MALGAALSACGGSDDVSVGLAVSGLTAEADSAVISVYAGARNCDAIQQEMGAPIQVQDVRNINMPSQELDPIFNIRPGEYTIAIVVSNATPTEIAFGCTRSPVVVELGKKSIVNITVDPV